MERLRCAVERITYRNEQNGYAVIKCKAKSYNDFVTVVGEMPEVHVGAVLSFTGTWKMDAKYGRHPLIRITTGSRRPCMALPKAIPYSWPSTLRPLVAAAAWRSGMASARAGN